MLKIKSLRDEVRAAGLFQTREKRSWIKFTGMLTVIAGLLLGHAHAPLWGSLLLLPITSWLCATVAMIGHEGSHRGLSTHSFRNQLMFHLSFPVFGGVSANYWHWKHDGQHHAYPNVAELDPDIMLWPMASTANEYRRSSRPRKWFQRNLQGALFWPLCFLLVWSMRLSSISFLYEYARNKGIYRGWITDVACLLVHATLWVGLPFLVFGWSAVALYVGIWTFSGAVLSAIFSPAHIGLPVVKDPDDIWRLQFETTRNLIMPKWMSFFFIGLDHQIEHHLFPKVPHQNLAAVAKLTKAWAKRNGVPYHEIDYLDGLKDVTRFMKSAWRYEPEHVVYHLPIREQSGIKDNAA